MFFVEPNDVFLLLFYYFLLYAIVKKNICLPDLQMPSKAVKAFQQSWFQESLDGVKNSHWLERDPKDIGRAACSICPKPSSFSISQGSKALKQHSETKKHQENLEKSRRDPTFEQVKNIECSCKDVLAVFISYPNQMDLY